MFTGIVEELGTVVARDGSRLRIGATAVLDGVTIGDSTAVNGCCLTSSRFGDGLVGGRRERRDVRAHQPRRLGPATR